MRYFPALARGFVASASALLLAAPPVSAQTQTERLADIAKIVDAKRTALHIPGAALVIVQNDKIIYMEGMGERNIAKKEPVTPDTLFAIGSSSKGFTSFAVLIGEADKKLSLADSPKKFLPYFALQDKDADAKITLRDLMSHTSGLPRTDLLWYTNALSRKEVISALAYVEPTAKLGEKFQYQNICFSAAGESLARAENTPYEAFVQSRIFAPLGMTHTTFSVKEMQAAPDFAIGYAPSSNAKPPRALPLHVLQNIAPAGGINSSARDMARWLRVLTGGGTFDGKEILPEAEFAKLSEKQINVAGAMNYGLGWFIRDWHGHKVVEHGGNIDGFNAEVAFMPDQKLGFVLLTNVSASPLGETTLETIWTNLVGNPDAAKTTTPETPADTKNVPAKEEAGTYVTPGLNAEVTYKNDKLTLTVPGQPPYPLVLLTGRRYKLDTPAPDGFFVTFRAKKDKPTETEAFLEQPQGNLTLSRLDAPKADANPSANELLGTYAAEKKAEMGIPTLEILLRSKRLTLLVPGQGPYPLVPVDKNTYSSPSLPDSYRILVRRDARNAVSGIVLKQPNGDFAFTRTQSKPPFVSPLTPAALLAKMRLAYGGEAVLKKHTTRKTESTATIAAQGLTARITEWAKAPDVSATKTVYFALQPPKPIGTTRDIFDGKQSLSLSSFAPMKTETSGDAWQNTKNQSQFSPLLDAISAYKSVEITGQETVGGEPVYVIKKTPQKGDAVTEYVSTKTLRILRRESLSSTGDGDTAQSVPISQTFSDFRSVDGEFIPFRVVIKQPGMGTLIQTVQSVVFNHPIEAGVFAVVPAQKTNKEKKTP